MTPGQHVPLISWATHNTMATTTGRDGETLSQSLEKLPQFRLWSATRPHEVGIASNRGSAIPR